MTTIKIKELAEVLQISIRELSYRLKTERDCVGIPYHVESKDVLWAIDQYLDNEYDKVIAKELLLGE